MFLLGLQAAAWRVPFLPTRVGLGSDLFRDNPRLRTVALAVRRRRGARRRARAPPRRRPRAPEPRPTPAATPASSGPTSYFDDLFVGAADEAFVSRRARSCRPSELEPEVGRHAAASSAGCRSTGVVEAPGGAHFTSCVPDYDRDEAFQTDVRRDGQVARRVGRVPGQLARPRRGRVPGEARRVMSTTELGAPTRAEVCAVAVAECFRGDGEILANPIGTIPMIGGRLARATFEPDLMMTDGEAKLIANDEAIPDSRRQGRRALQPVPAHVRRGVERPAPRDDGRHPGRPLRQPEHRRHRRLRASPEGAAARLPRRAGQHDQRHDLVLGAEPLAHRCSCEHVDTVCGIGYDRAADARPGRRPLPRDPPGRHQPRACSTSRRPTTACGCGRCTPASPSTRSSRPPASSWSCPTTCPSPACRPTTSSA